MYVDHLDVDLTSILPSGLEIAQLYQLLDKLPVSVVVIKDRHIQFANQQFCVSLGYTSQELNGQSTEILYPSMQVYREIGRTLMTQLHKNGLSVQESQLKRRDGSVMDVLVRTAPIDPSDISVGVISLGIDITDHKKARLEHDHTVEALRQSEDRYRNLFDGSPDAIFLAGVDDGILLDANQTAIQLIGRSREELVGQSFEILHPPRLINHARTLFEDTVTRITDHKPAPSSMETMIKHADGHEIPVEIVALRLDLQNRPVLYSQFRDITLRKAAERKIRQFTRVVEQSPASVVITDIDAVIEYVNPKFTEVTGYTPEEAMGQKAGLMSAGKTDPAFYRAMWKQLLAGQEWSGDFYNRRKNGELYWEHTIISPITNDYGEVTHYVAVKEDVTRRKLMAEQTRQQERLAAVGQLAAGIAHDFNNLLTAIIGYAQLIQLQADVPGRRDLEVIVQQSERAAQLVSQILDFSRASSREERTIEMRNYLKETIRFIERTIPEHIQIVFDSEPGDYFVKADATQLQQIVTNLAVNARDAMAEEGGVLTFKLRRVAVTANQAQIDTCLQPGTWIKLMVSDTGSGIPKSMQTQIFDPFFTTKPPGEGTGLGLAQVYGIVKQHNGCINVDSTVGQGTTFSLYFPRNQHGKPVGDATVVATETPVGQGQTILLAEDDRTVRNVLRTTLESLNYQVIAVQDGQAALEAFYEHRQTINLLLTDAIMPKMSGFQLIALVKSEEPNLPVVVLSGYADERKYTPEFLELLADRLTKPVHFGVLAQTVARVLNIPH